jgi:hypothetical protein
MGLKMEVGRKGLQSKEGRRFLNTEKESEHILV